MKIPLFPLEDALHFQTGEPLNVQAIPYEGADAACQCPGYDYSGRDARIQFPKNFHVVAGRGGAAGGFHQNCAAFEPWRVQVMPDRAVGRSGNVLRCVGGRPGQPGKFAVSRWFNNAVQWADGHALRVEYIFMPSSESVGRFYMNLELRGELNFTARKNESVVAFGVHFADSFIMVAYWLNAQDGSRVDEARAEIKIPHALQVDRWHKLILQLEPAQVPDTWNVDARLSVQQKTVWTFETNALTAPNNVRSISQLIFADERERDEAGGVWYVRRAMPWRVVEDDLC